MSEMKINGPLTAYNEPFIIQRADPYIVQAADGSYYFTASHPSYDFIVLRHSETLLGLKDAPEKIIWKKHAEGIMGNHIWAPELHHIFGKWYIYFAAGDAENRWRERPYVLECQGENPMEDEWVELGQMQSNGEEKFSFESFSLDGTVFEHKGEYYFIWAEKIGAWKMISNLYIAKLAEPNKLGTKQVLLSTPCYDWEQVDEWVEEGPAVLKKGDKIYVTFSASATGACYCMGMLWADAGEDLLDPQNWTKSREPIVKTDAEKGIFGPGHNSFTKDETGRDVCVFHARTYEELQDSPLYDPNRHAMLMYVEWDGEERPIFDLKNTFR